MITRLEARNYRSFRHLSQNLQAFQVLIGPNASGKSTLLDLITLISDIIAGKRVDDILNIRSQNFYDLTWQKQSDAFAIAVEVVVPPQFNGGTLRYEAEIGLTQNDIELLRENLWVLPAPSTAPSTNILTENVPVGWKNLLRKTSSNFGADAEVSSPNFWSGKKNSSLAFLPSLLTHADDRPYLPMVNWFRIFLGERVQPILLNVEALRQPTQSTFHEMLQSDGGNLPTLIQHLQQKYPEHFQDWLRHVQVALPELENVRVFERPEERSRYLLVKYTSGLEVPAWVVSDGTLRLLALTALAYSPVSEGVYLIDEPENGIHPRIVEVMYQPLQFVYGAQVLIATHSTEIVSLLKPHHILFFTKNDGVQIIRGDEHPLLQSPDGTSTLSMLFAGGAFVR